MAFGLGGVILLFLFVYAIVDIISTDESVIRNLPKFGWLLVVILVPALGALLWFMLGRPTGTSLRPGSTGTIGNYRPRHPPAPRRSLPPAPKGPEDSPDFIAKLGDQQRRLNAWEEDLRRREDELRRREQGEEPAS